MSSLDLHWRLVHRPVALQSVSEHSVASLDDRGREAPPIELPEDQQQRERTHQQEA